MHQKTQNNQIAERSDIENYLTSLPTDQKLRFLRFLTNEDSLMTNNFSLTYH